MSPARAAELSSDRSQASGGVPQPANRHNNRQSEAARFIAPEHAPLFPLGDTISAC